MSDNNRAELAEAIQDFQVARRKAALQDITARLTGQSSDLLPFEEIRQKFRLQGGASLGLREIQIDAIVGSVDRYHDFNRHFLPRDDSALQRWAGVMSAQLGLSGVPPIDVYKIGEVYFVIDGNHRVSVARQLNMPTIEAYVTEFKSKVPIQPNDSPDEILIKAEYNDFLSKTRLDELRPGSRFEVTTPDRYWVLEAQIQGQQLWLSKLRQREASYEEAVVEWYDNVYRPVVQLIREKGILRDFPGRTETDMYLWIFKHRAELKERLGWDVDAESVVSDLAVEHSDNTSRALARASDRLWHAITPQPLKAGPEPGQWRREWLEARPRDRLFGNILVTLTQNPITWQSLTQAITIAQRDGSQIYGLYVIDPNDDPDQIQVKPLREEFRQRCAAAGVPGRLAVTAGNLADSIVERARWVDLVVVNPTHLPGSGVLSKFTSPVHSVVQRSPRPVLVVRKIMFNMDRTLVAFDGSPKAHEGLYLATYLAKLHGVDLVVGTVKNGQGGQSRLKHARKHLEARGVQATFVQRDGPVAETLLALAAEHACDLVIMGGYGFKPLLSAVLGSTVDTVISQSERPLLICR